MCVFKPPSVKVPAPTPPVERQPVQVPKEMVNGADGKLLKRFRRGFWASVMTSPQGVSGPPSVTGTPST
jgi:hypothetical protein